MTYNPKSVRVSLVRVALAVGTMLAVAALSKGADRAALVPGRNASTLCPSRVGMLFTTTGARGAPGGRALDPDLVTTARGPAGAKRLAPHARRDDNNT